MGNSKRHRNKQRRHRNFRIRSKLEPSHSTKVQVRSKLVLVRSKLVQVLVRSKLVLVLAHSRLIWQHSVNAACRTSQLERRRPKPERQHRLQRLQSKSYAWENLR